MFRFVRQSPIEIDAHNPNVVYHGSQYVHKTIDGGVHWTKFSPDVTANGPEGHVTSGEPITRDMTGEEVYAALYSMRSSRLEPGVFWTGSNDGPVWVTRDNGKTWKNVTPRRSAAGRPRAHDRGFAASQGIGVRLGLPDVPERLQAVPLHDQRLRRALDAADRRRQRHPGRSADARRARGSRAGRIALRRHAARARTCRSIRASTGRRCSRICRRRRSPTSRSTTAISSRRRWGGRSGSWTTSSPLRQIAASVTKPTRHAHRPTIRTGRCGAGSAGAAHGPPTATSSRRLDADRRAAASVKPARRAAATTAAARGDGAAIKPFDGSNVFLFTPAPAYRMHYSRVTRPSRSCRSIRRPARGSTTTSPAPSGEVKLEILDAAGTVVRSYSSAARPRGAGGRGGGRRGGGLPSTLPTKVGMNRFVWDLALRRRTGERRRRHGGRRIRRRRADGRARRVSKRGSPRAA